MELEGIRVEAEQLAMQEEAQTNIDLVSADLAEGSFEKVAKKDGRLARIPQPLREQAREQAVALIRGDLREIFGNMAEASSMGDTSAMSQMNRLIALTAEKIAERVFESIEQKSRILELQEEVGKDTLTGLFNRNVLKKRLPEEIDRADRTNQPLCVLIFDLDEFKGVNDTHGHQAGDKVLEEVARRLQEVMRGTDVLVRLGGDEFVIVCPNTDKMGAVLVAHRIVKVLGNQIKVKTESGEFTADIGASIGIGVHKGKGVDPNGEGAIKTADDCLYVLKGAKPDRNGKTEQRRGQIAADGEVYSHEEADRIMQEMSESENARHR